MAMAMQSQQHQINPNMANPALTNGGPLPMDDDMIGAIKIKDALFIGDEFAAQDLEFVVANKVTHIVNCAGKQVPNHWEPIGVTYLTFYWLDQENQILFDAQDETTNKIFEFIDGALQKAESVLVHSVRGQSRSSCVIAAYLMRKYRWSLLKTLEFLNSRRPDLEIRATFIHQLSAYEARLYKNGNGPKTQKWTEISEENCFLESEELLLRNTFLNAQMGPIAQYNPALLNDKMNPNLKLRWIDEFTQGREQLGQEGDPEQDLCLKEVVEDVTVHRRINPNDLKSSIRVPICQNQVMKHYPSIYYQNQEIMGKNLSHTAAPIGANQVPHAHLHNNQQQAVMHLQQQQQQNNPIRHQQNSSISSSGSQRQQVQQQTFPNKIGINNIPNSQQPQQQINIRPIQGFNESSQLQNSFDNRLQNQFQNQTQPQQNKVNQSANRPIAQPPNQNMGQNFYPKIDDSVHSEDLSELNNEIYNQQQQQNNRQTIQMKSMNNLGQNIQQNNMQIPHMNPSTNIERLDNRYAASQQIANNSNFNNNAPPSQLNQRQQQQTLQSNIINPSQLLIQDKNQQNYNRHQGVGLNLQPQQLVQQQPTTHQINADILRKNLEEQRRIHQMATQLGSNQTTVQTTTQMQQVQPNVTNIINNNNINNFFIQNPPIEMLSNPAKLVSQNNNNSLNNSKVIQNPSNLLNENQEKQVIGQKINQIRDSSQQPMQNNQQQFNNFQQNITNKPPIGVNNPQQNQNAQSVQLNQKFSQNNALNKQRSGSARPAQNIVGDAEPLGPNKGTAPIIGHQNLNSSQNTNNNHTQIINTEASADLTNQNNHDNQLQKKLNPQQQAAGPQGHSQINIKKKRNESPSTNLIPTGMTSSQQQAIMNKYNIQNSQTNGSQQSANMYQQLQQQIKTQQNQNRIMSSTNPTAQSAKSNGFGSARQGAQITGIIGVGSSNGAANYSNSGKQSATSNKLNSFRGGGPIRATQNAIDNPGQVQVNQSAIVKLNGGISSSASNQRPNSSKPILKTSFNNDNNGNQKNESGPLAQIVNENKQQRPNSSNQRPSSPGTGKIVKASLGDQSKPIGIKGKPRLRSASPAGANNTAGNNSQTNNNNSGVQNSSNTGANNSNQAIAFLSKNAKKIASAHIANKQSQQPLGSRLQGVVGAATSNPSAKHVPQLYMRGYSPSKPKWKN